MKAKELREKTDEQLVELEIQLRSDLLRARIARATSRAVSPSRFSDLRRTIARVKTLQTERSKGAK
jgi:large subunit ribosomal protein L29